MKNLSHVGSEHYSSSSSSTANNIADEGEDLLLHYWNAGLVTMELVSESVPVVEEGNRVVDEVEDMWNNGVVEGVEKNGVVEGVEKNGVVESMAGAADDMAWGPRGSSEEYGGFEFPVLEPTVGFEMSKETGVEGMARGAPPGSREFASGGSDEDRGMFAYEMVGVEAPPEGMVNKRGADRIAGAPPAARGSKRQRSPSGWIETASGGSNGGGGDVSDDGRAKRLWVKDRDDGWWSTVSSPLYPDADFKRDFHMSRSTFAALCKMLAPAVEKEDTKMRTAISVTKRVAVCVWRLATGEPLRLVKGRFGIGLSTVHKIMREVSAAIKTIVLPKVVLWPDAATAASVAAKFQELTGGIPDVIGAVYNSHIPVIAPKHDCEKYHDAGLTDRNGKISYSVRMQASVDADGAFTDVSVGYPAVGVPDEDVLPVSWLETRTGDMLAQGKRLVGGAGYPLTEWMLVPYSDQNQLTRTQHEFNERVAAARAVALDAFQRLKTRWACLQKRTDIQVAELPAIVSTCCALHNWCESRGDQLDPELPRFEIVDDNVVAPNQVSSAAAVHVRDAIANNLLY